MAAPPNNGGEGGGGGPIRLPPAPFREQRPLSEGCCLRPVRGAFSFSRAQRQQKTAGFTSEGKATSLPVCVYGLVDKTVQINDPNASLGQQTPVVLEGSIPGAGNQNPTNQNWQVIATVVAPGFVQVPQNVGMLRISAASVGQPIDPGLSAQYIGNWYGEGPYVPTEIGCRVIVVKHR